VNTNGTVGWETPSSERQYRALDAENWCIIKHSRVAGLEPGVQQEMAVDRKQVTAHIIEKMREKGLKFDDVARKLGLDKTWTTAALLGQHPFTAERAEQVQRLLDLPSQAVVVLQESPTRGCLESAPPTDPTMYRIYEVLQVYGTTIKALIHEEFGDGIMSAVNFSLSVDREDTAGATSKDHSKRCVPSLPGSCGLVDRTDAGPGAVSRTPFVLTKTSSPEPIPTPITVRIGRQQKSRLRPTSSIGWNQTAPTRHARPHTTYPSCKYCTRPVRSVSIAMDTRRQTWGRSRCAA